MSEKITLEEPVSITTDSGQVYRAEIEEGVVAIHHEDNERWILVGHGIWEDSSIEECNADLGEDGYELLNAAILDALAE